MKNVETLYIDTENISVHRSSEHLVLEKDNKKIASVPIVETKSIILLKSSLVTAPALELVYSKGIDLIYIDRNGKVLGRMNSSKGGGAELRLAQYRFYDNQAERTGIAKKFVDLYRKHREEGWYSIFLNQSSELKEALKNGKEYEPFKWK